MSTSWTFVLLLLGMVAFLIGVALFLIQRRLASRLAEAREELQHEMHAFAGAINAINLRLDELRQRAPENATEAVASAKTAEPAAELANAAAIAPETVVAITAAATAMLGSKARIRSISPGAGEAVSAWSQQGRATVQSSHNVRGRQ